MPGGPVAVPAAWLEDEPAYREAVLTAAEQVLALPSSGPAVYVPKAAAELEHLLALWPHVIAVPTSAALSIVDLIRARAFPVHPLAVTEAPVWADGRWCSPAEMFFHDVDHARFKIREDLLARGIAVADPYVDGSTHDPASGRHRTILDLVSLHVDGDGWARAEERSARADGWLDEIDRLGDRDLADAARWLLFELVHEKALPLEPSVLACALAGSEHVDKLRAKAQAGFFADHGPSPGSIAALGSARRRLGLIVGGGEPG